MQTCFMPARVMDKRSPKGCTHPLYRSERERERVSKWEEEKVRQRGRKREREGEREREYLFLKGMTGALAPFSYLA
jgi:hypothetical protein